MVNQIMIPHIYNQKIPLPYPPQVQLGPNLVYYYVNIMAEND